jgi:signal transduction histidine kinase
MRPTLKSGSPQSGKFKIGLLVLAFMIVAGTLLYTHEIVRRLEVRQKQVADLYARSLEYLANAPNSMGGDYSFVFDEIIRAIDFPIVLTDARNEPIPPLDGSYANAIKNIGLDTTLTLEQQRQAILELIAAMDMQNTPIKVAYQDTIILNYVHYGESDLVTQLRWLPFIEIGIAGLFILVGYISFSYIKRNEQSNIWVGMARETAHQLGTPISSMLGWVELLKTHVKGNPRLTEIVQDMEGDTRRLEKIADRFSKIGSKPDLREENLGEVAERVIAYFERRIPQSGKRVSLQLVQARPVAVNINRELFEWVLENLIKNALDAIENGAGSIIVSVSEEPGIVNIDVTDTGKGVDGMHKRDIFRPGFSTKSRGWGLGLSLSKRIVETYHKGRLMLKESRPGEGTTFRIRLVKGDG